MSRMQDGIVKPTAFLLMERSGSRVQMLYEQNLRARVHLNVAELHLPLHNIFTSEFLNREYNSRDLLRKY